MSIARRLAFLWCLLCLPAFVAPAGAAAPSLVLPGPDVLRLDQGELAWLRDAGGRFSLEDVRRADAAGAFVPLSGSLSRGYTDDVYWLRLRLRNDGEPERYWLEVMPPFLDDLRLYKVMPDGRVRLHQAGDRYPVAVQDSRAPSPLFRLELPRGESTLYLRIRTSSSLLALVTLYRPPALQRHLSTQGIQYGTYFGVLAMVLLLNLINWRLLRDNLYGIYCAYIAMQLVYFAAAYGVLAQYLFPDMPAVSDRLVGIGLGTTVATGSLFIMRLLRVTRRTAPLPWLMFHAMVLVGVVTCFAAIAGIYSPVARVAQVVLALTALVTIPWLVTRVVREANPERRLAAFAFLLYLAPVLLGALGFLGLLEASGNTLFAAQVANLLHVWLLHFAIARRVRDADLAREEFARQAAVARVEAEQERQRTDEQSRMLSMITHEVRTPVAIVQSALQSLRLLDPQPPADRHSRYDRIDRSVRRMNQLLELVAASERVRAARDSEVRRTELGGLTRQAVGDLDPEQQGRVFLQAPAGGLYVNASPALLRIALGNLLDNALKYSPPGSPVDVHIAVADDGRATWTVDDTGPGIPEASLPVLFDKYWRGGEQQGVPGLGLGLYIVRGIVEEAGGTVACLRAPGGGTRFVCSFPPV